MASLLIHAAALGSLPAGERLGPNVTLANGVVMPRVGFGCAGRLGADVLGEALRAGYRAFDTAQAWEWYDEPRLGEAIAASDVPRSALFITTKVHPRDFGPSATPAALRDSFRSLRTDVLDAVLLHYPGCWGSLCGGKKAEGGWREAWRALEAAYDAGTVRAIGVCNFGAHELGELWSFSRVRPQLVQNWMDPFHADGEVRAWCAQRGVVFQAFSTLGTQHRVPAGNPVLRSAVIQKVADGAGVSVARAALRWALQRGACVIPRSQDGARMRDNLRLFDFELTEAQLRAIDALDGTDPSHAPRAPRPADAPLPVRFRNRAHADLALRWGGDASARWPMQPGAVVELTTYAGHTFQAELADSVGDAAGVSVVWRRTFTEDDLAALDGGVAGRQVHNGQLAVDIEMQDKVEL